MPDVVQACYEVLPLHGRVRAARQHDVSVNGTQRIHREHVLDVRDHQLLVLLLVMDAELEQIPDAQPGLSVGCLDPLAPPPVPVLAIRADLAHGAPRALAAPRPPATRAAPS